MIEIWGRKTSSNVQAVMWAVAELQQHYKRYDIGHRFGGNDTPAFLAMNPNGTVPVVSINGGTPLWESGAILRHLAALYGDPPFWPSDVNQRCVIDQWAEWSKINIAINFTMPVFWPLVRIPAEQRDMQALTVALQRLTRFLNIAEQQLLRHPYLAGPEFTLADIQFGHILYRYFDLDIRRAALPAVEAYYQRLTRRAAYREHVMVSYQELAV
ncbi:MULTISPECIES: glutathione S-transferase family protein [Tatumella]|uniref:Glutathione S-transferase family protein n=1 Tax=Tatumella punctata TaxID=399969 RepID=A0ABW1VKI5_9GAMM|nr:MULTISPECIES: glutathione S-transferase family protein [unclassified Tatumella]MBS0855092.1 glutathione S-transferase family protein [Tatumella sp. JGM16]MBS0876122.1 glutathione S-transferase family protein [Tatumella sp. JGM82]MBS0889170.1 glutathione S-transferase family protein [Tatumella sp. JGM94]MBS0892709.1 glutathione S-transferase family protein [Tatumella sp. JGM130]MBS0901052.1 glutathione S-transferase family protein [Tatumella sp. JGM100]